MANKYRKKYSSWREMNTLRPQWGKFSNRFDWQIFKCLTIPRTGDDVGQRKFSWF